MLSASLPPLLDAGYEIGVIFHQRSRCSVNPAKKISSPDLLGKNKILHLVVSGSFFAGLQFKDESSRGGDGIRAWIGRLPPAPLQASRMILCRCWKAMDHTELFCLFIGRTSAICVWESSLINVRFSASCYCQSGWETWQVHGQKCDVEIPCI